VEPWNIGYQKDISHFNFIVNPAGGGTIIPIFHCSIIPIVSEANYLA
jgi:hypothetical protein